MKREFDTFKARAGAVLMVPAMAAILAAEKPSPPTL
jgi:hypothetical protein